MEKKTEDTSYLLAFPIGGLLGIAIFVGNIWLWLAVIALCSLLVYYKYRMWIDEINDEIREKQRNKTLE